MSSDPIVDTAPGILAEPAGALNPAALELESITRRLLRGSGVYALTSFSIKAFNFLLLALYSRFLRPADYGIVVLAEIAAMLTSTVIGLGLNAAVVRLYFQHASDSSRQQRYVSTLLRFSVAAITTGLAAAFIAGALAPSFFRERVKVEFFPYLALALGAAAATQIAEFRFALYQAEQRPQTFVWLSLFSC